MKKAKTLKTFLNRFSMADPLAYYYKREDIYAIAKATIDFMMSNTEVDWTNWEEKAKQWLGKY